MLKRSRRGKLPLVDGEGNLVGLATRTLFRDNARMPFGGERAHVVAAAGAVAPAGQASASAAGTDF